MKVRTVAELQNKLDAEISWRKKELVDYKFIVERNKNALQITPLVRGGIALGYAHWEGFIKNAASIFISYISTKKIPLKDLKTNFTALNYMRSLNKQKSIEECIELIEKVIEESDKPCKIFDKDVIDTKSNLRFYVLKDILLSLGFEDDFFSSKENFLDKKLVDPRNDIAHGTYREVSYEDYKIVFDNILPLMEHFKTLVENATSTESYKN
ncbi:hypothetical protein JM79_2107 [Gramella sp. Hel_I_59]|uniref:MAE_28990/MAE_18760 family HEPN-like nuclease n=1 Tax=Gramella sp. Hel_I_59 TaxID=1249978 RepID=UPI001151BB32|nr:MAE_28990/MAE_18760 family HEPN-like nuclease [Gramella sp. Hel_I_59]TQI71180.1 hypothetical protein JM79_2107 [Gramella sp. Hel_I_59]